MRGGRDSREAPVFFGEPLRMNAIPVAPSPAPAPGGLKFQSPDDFRQALRRGVDEYFATPGRQQRDCWQMYLKSAVVLGWCAAAYGLLLVVGGTWWLALPLAMILGLGLAAVGFNVQHDGNHGAYSNSRLVNRLAAATLDLMGGSSYVWARKHNSIHHSYTNVTGHDDDINIGLLGRLSPHQKHLPFHRLQHVYLWFLYGFLPVKWHVYDDFHNVLVGRIGEHRISRPHGWDLAMFFGGKAAFFGLALGVPMLFYSWWWVLVLYMVSSFVQGVALSVVFQMAHCVEEADFPLPAEESGKIEHSWATHQVETTVNFAPRNRLLTWYVGGLNYQVEHHLFPQICHIHYPAISRIVERCCREYGLAYKSQKSFLGGIASHFRWLRRLGRETAVA
jgi:linoleoyl-CoA desaturase